MGRLWGPDDGTCKRILDMLKTVQLSIHFNQTTKPIKEHQHDAIHQRQTSPNNIQALTDANVVVKGSTSQAQLIFNHDVVKDSTDCR